MTIHFYDGGYADCSEIEVIGDRIYWDGYRYYPLADVEWIEDDDGSDITCDYISCSSKTGYRDYVKASQDDDELDLYDMINFIDAEWDNLGCGEHMTRREAAEYLGHSVRGMTKEEIDEEVSELQKAYYVDGDIAGASDQEIIDQYNYMVNLKGK